jgi:hypothetical protein
VGFSSELKRGILRLTEALLTNAIDKSMQREIMHLWQFDNVLPSNVLTLHEFDEGFLFLQDLKKKEATFLIQGFVTQAHLCPSNERFECVKHPYKKLI